MPYTVLYILVGVKAIIYWQVPLELLENLPAHVGGGGGVSKYINVKNNNGMGGE